MHICVVSPTAITDKERWGGVHTHTEMLCKILVKLGHQVTLITSLCQEGLTTQLFNGNRIIYIGKLQSRVVNDEWLRKAGQTFLSLHQQNPFHCIFSEGHFACRFKNEKKIRNLPLFYFIHNPSSFHFYNNWIEVQNLRTFISYFLRTVPSILYCIFFYEIPLAHFCTKVLSVSALKAKQFCKFYNISPEKVETVNNWVDTNLFAPDNIKKSRSRKKWSIVEKDLVFLLVGAIWRPKGFQVAIQSFSKIIHQLPNSVLLICGAGREKQKLTHLIKQRRLENKVRFLGKINRPELPLIYNMADIFLMPSLMHEGLAYTLIEAMACGLPVIASKRDGNIEAVGDAGILVPVGDVNVLAEAMLELARNSEKRKALSEKARKRVLRLFSEETAIKKISQIIRELQPQNEILTTSSLTEKSFWEEGWQNFLPKKVETVLYADLFEKYLKPDNSLKCIEIGCFPGNFLIYFHKKFGYKIYGIDYIDKVEDLKCNFEFNGIKEYKIFCEDFTQWKTDQQFDVVFSDGFVEHFENYEEIIEKHINLLNRSGILFIALPNFRYAQFLFHRIFDYQNLSRHNLKVMNLRFFKKFLEERNFEILHLGYYGRIGFWVRNLHKRNVILRFIIRIIIYMGDILKKYVKVPNRFFSPYIVCIAFKKS